MSPSSPDACGTDPREAARVAFLRDAGLGGWRREALGGDASTRRYERLHGSGGATLIFMDQPPAAESRPCPPEADDAEREKLGYNALARLAAGRVDAFTACAAWLNGEGFSAPSVRGSDAAAGLAVLEDLGDDLFATVLASGGDEAGLYEAAIDTLAELHRRAPPAALEGPDGPWPLLTYDDLALRTAGDLFIDWVPALYGLPPFTEPARAEWEALWSPVRARGEARAEVFCHRDYHAENLVWLPEREGAARVGLLDFQDAVRAPRAWDLSMLLHDARRDVSPELRAAMLDRYLAAERGQVDSEALRADFALFGALNIVRIIGVFHRLIGRDGKPRYREFLPRMWGYLDETLQHPELAPLARWLSAHVPAGVRG